MIPSERLTKGHSSSISEVLLGEASEDSHGKLPKCILGGVSEKKKTKQILSAYLKQALAEFLKDFL